MQNRFILSLCAALSAATASAQTSLRIASIAPTGESGVGRRQIYWIDSARRDPVDSSRFREVTGWVWYPAPAGKSQELPLPQAWQDQRIDVLREKLGPQLAEAMKAFTVNERTGAQVLSGKSQFPVLLFVPGLSWLASDYSVMIDDLVSHGYVVVGISPSGFSDPVEFPDGRVMHRSLGQGEKIGTDQSIVQDDAVFALRKIREMNDTGFLRGRIDSGRIGAFGHSLGGTTALVIASRDTTVRAAINIDGDPMGDVREARPKQPLLLISSDSPTLDTVSTAIPRERRELIQQGIERSEKRRTDDWNAIASQSVSARRVFIPGSQHLNFEDAALASGLVTDKQARWMKFGAIEPERALTTLSSIVRSFFDQSLGTGTSLTGVMVQVQRMNPGQRNF